MGRIRESEEHKPQVQLVPVAEDFEERFAKMPTMLAPYSGKPLSQSGLFWQRG